MDEKDVERYWDENAEAWTKLSRLGYDVYRNYVNTPTFFKILPNVEGLKGLDVGCGEGYNTRLTAKKGAKMTAIDISEKFIELAKDKEEKTPLGITYEVSSALNLPYDDEKFDFVINGFFQFSISHPCFSTSIRKWIKDDEGELAGLMVGNYFNELEEDMEEWIFSAAPEELTREINKFKVPRFHLTLSSWLNLLIQTGFILKEFQEPYANDKLVERYPNLKDTQFVGYFLIIRCQKS
ncbi:MAG: class I SAM-dependent methyltransferase [Candidatus Lokiarchaeota archaeon]